MENPIKELLKEMPVLKLAEKTGLNPGTVRQLGRMSKEEVGNIRLSTVKILYDTIGVSLSDYYLDK